MDIVDYHADMDRTIDNRFIERLEEQAHENIPRIQEQILENIRENSNVPPNISGDEDEYESDVERKNKEETLILNPDMDKDIIVDNDDDDDNDDDGDDGDERKSNAYITVNPNYIPPPNPDYPAPSPPLSPVDEDLPEVDLVYPVSDVPPPPYPSYPSYPPPPPPPPPPPDMQDDDEDVPPPVPRIPPPEIPDETDLQIQVPVMPPPGPPSAIPPPPPPPPPPSTVPSNIPPKTIMDEIKEGKKLEHVEVEKKPRHGLVAPKELQELRKNLRKALERESELTKSQIEQRNLEAQRKSEEKARKEREKKLAKMTPEQREQYEQYEARRAAEQEEQQKHGKLMDAFGEKLAQIRAAQADSDDDDDEWEDEPVASVSAEEEPSASAPVEEQSASAPDEEEEELEDLEEKTIGFWGRLGNRILNFLFNGIPEQATIKNVREFVDGMYNIAPGMPDEDGEKINKQKTDFFEAWEQKTDEERMKVFTLYVDSLLKQIEDDEDTYLRINLAQMIKAIDQLYFRAIDGTPLAQSLDFRTWAPTIIARDSKIPIDKADEYLTDISDKNSKIFKNAFKVVLNPKLCPNVVLKQIVNALLKLREENHAYFSPRLVWHFFHQYLPKITKKQATKYHITSGYGRKIFL